MPRDRTPEEEAIRQERLRLDAREDRARYVRNAFGSLAIEGLEPDAETRAIAQRYVDSEITGDEMTELILGKYPRTRTQ